MMKLPQASVEPLSQALTMREAKAENPGEVAEARYQLARALWEASPEQRERATQLAASAREAMPKEGQPELEKWLLSHVVPDAGLR